MRMIRGETTRRAIFRLGRVSALALLRAISRDGRAVAADAPDGYRYTDPLDRFVLTIPAGWKQQQTTDSAVAGAWATDAGAALFTVLYLPVNDGTAAEELEELFLPVLSTLPGYVEADRRYVSLHEGDKPLLDYFTTDATGRVQRVQQIFFTHGRDGLVITFRCLAADAAKYAAVVGGMVGSFTV